MPGITNQAHPHLFQAFQLQYYMYMNLEKVCTCRRSELGLRSGMFFHEMNTKIPEALLNSLPEIHEKKDIGE
jgi:hypothetical protein